jgi:hypothetical protein
MTYLEMYNLAVENSEFKNRTAIAIVDILDDIFNEAPSTAYHEQRVMWSQHASNRLMRVRDEMLWSVVTHWLVNQEGVSISDSDLKSVISSIVNLYATAYYEDLINQAEGSPYFSMAFFSSPSAGDLADMEIMVPKKTTITKLKVSVYGSAGDYCNIKVFKRPLSSGSIQNDANSVLIADTYAMNGDANLVGDETSTFIGKEYQFTNGFSETAITEGEIFYAEADAVSGTVDKCVVMVITK